MRSRPPRRPRGMVLVIVMLLLVVALIGGLTAMNTATLEERVAANIRDRHVAFQAAESALRDAETTIATHSDFDPLRASAFSGTCPSGRCASTAASPLWSGFTDADWASGKTRAYGASTGATALSGVAAPPRFVIEYQGTVYPIVPGQPCEGIFLITARARGTTTGSEVMLQSTYRHRADECYAAQ